MYRFYCILWLLVACCLPAEAQEAPLPVRRLLNDPCMRGASFSLIVKELHTGQTVAAYDTLRQLTPASVMKVVTTATALELLGEDYRFPTVLEYDGTIEGGVLRGNLYIRGSGDPTLGSAHFAPDRYAYTPDQNTFIPQWIAALREAGIRQIRGQVIADESIFDTEGTSPKWVQEDLGSYYGAGSYGLSVFDNLYKLYLRSGAAGTRPTLKGCDPQMPDLHFHNGLTAAYVRTDSSFILGAPFATERYLYGTVPANRETITLKGDIPDPPLFLAQYLTEQLERNGIAVEGEPSSFRRMQEQGVWHPGKRTELAVTYSPTLREIVGVTNRVSHNLFADALLKTLGLQYRPAKGEVVSSFERGIRVLRAFWEDKGVDPSDLWLYDGSGLAVTDKVSASFLGGLLRYMANESPAGEAFTASLPQAGVEGSVRNFLKGTSLQGLARLKSGSMSRVRAYAGYIRKGGKTYAVAVLVNHYAGESRPLTQQIEQLLQSLFAALPH